MGGSWQAVPALRHEGTQIRAEIQRRYVMSTRLESPPSTAISNAKWLVLAAAFLGWMFDGLEMGIFPQVARPAISQLLHTADDNVIKRWDQIITAAFLFGAAFGGLVFGWLGDKVGRVKAMASSILVYSAFTGLLYFVSSTYQFAVLRFLAAIGMGGEWALGVALVMEVWDAKYRPILAGLIGAASNVGFVLVGTLGAIIRINQSNWKWMVVLGAAPAVLTFIVQMFVPESHKWKESQKQAPSRPMAELFGNPKLARVMILAICFASVALLGTWGAVQKVSPWVGGMQHKTPRAMGLTVMYSGYGAIVGCLIAPLLAAALNRRMAYFLLCLGSFITCEAMFWGFHDYTNGLLVMVFIVGGISAAFYGWLPLYLPELFPTRVRATAQGIAFNFGRILAGFGVIWGGTIGGSYARMGTYVSLIYVVGMVLIWFSPETKGKPLPE
jgi:SHS family sialic acid transporter-like MFS transporter